MDCDEICENCRYFVMSMKGRAACVWAGWDRIISISPLEDACVAFQEAV